MKDAATVLVIRDEVLGQRLQDSPLARARVQIRVAASAWESLDLARMQMPTVVVMGAELGGMSHVDLARALRALPRGAAPQLVAITAAQSPSQWAELSGAGVNRSLPADVSAADLSTALADVLGLRPRADRRRSLKTLVRVERENPPPGAQASTLAQAVEIGGGGMRILSRDALVPGEPVRVIMALPGPLGRLVARAEVVRVVDESQAQYALKFLGLSRLIRERLTRLVAGEG